MKKAFLSLSAIALLGFAACERHTAEETKWFSNHGHDSHDEETRPEKSEVKTESATKPKRFIAE